MTSTSPQFRAIRKISIEPTGQIEGGDFCGLNEISIHAKKAGADPELYDVIEAEITENSALWTRATADENIHFSNHFVTINK